jgi:hypothetical protein
MKMTDSLELGITGEWGCAQTTPWIPKKKKNLGVVRFPRKRWWKTGTKQPQCLVCVCVCRARCQWGRDYLGRFQKRPSLPSYSEITYPRTQRTNQPSTLFFPSLYSPNPPGVGRRDFFFLSPPSCSAISCRKKNRRKKIRPVYPRLVFFSFFTILLLLAIYK